MSNEWKFRVWDKTSKEFAGKGFSLTNSGSILRYNKEVENPDNYILHLFTGVLDKYNKEIFEGDIVEHTIAESGELKQSVGIVGYDPTKGMFILNDGGKHPLGELFSLRKLGNPQENSVLYDLYVKNKGL
jgi:uncharacterized phage protein (TIGR01671 family)